MQTVLIVVHVMLALGLVILVLLQRSEGGGLGMGGGGGGMGGLVSSRSAANFLTRTTAILAACFMVTSIVLTILARDSAPSRSIMDEVEAEPVAEEVPIEDDLPSVPVSD